MVVLGSGVTERVVEVDVAQLAGHHAVGSEDLVEPGPQTGAAAHLQPPPEDVLDVPGGVFAQPVER